MRKAEIAGRYRGAVAVLVEMLAENAELERKLGNLGKENARLRHTVDSFESLLSWERRTVEILREREHRAAICPRRHLPF